MNWESDFFDTRVGEDGGKGEIRGATCEIVLKKRGEREMNGGVCLT